VSTGKKGVGGKEVSRVPFVPELGLKWDGGNCSGTASHSMKTDKRVKEEKKYRRHQAGCQGVWGNRAKSTQHGGLKLRDHQPWRESLGSTGGVRKQETREKVLNWWQVLVAWRRPARAMQMDKVPNLVRVTGAELTTSVRNILNKEEKIVTRKVLEAVMPA